jgi:predicted HTH transcriptional regulator
MCEQYKLFTQLEEVVNMEKYSKEELQAMVCELEETLLALEERLCKKVKVQKPGRMVQVLEILQKGPITTSAIAERVGIDNRNVSSQLTYLRKGDLNNTYYDIGKDSLGRHVILGSRPKN